MGTDCVEMVRIRKAATRLPLRLLCLSALPIGLGILKVYLHYNSHFRSELLDYLVAAGLILGGVFLFSQKSSKVILLISGSLIVVELFKAVVDYRDLYDLALTITAIIYLSIPLLRNILENARSS